MAEAQALDPGAPELHDLNTIDGLIAFKSGDVARAKECLSKSVRVCEQNEFACFACSIRPFNLLLAQKLLQRGEHAAVIGYLSPCQGIWEYEAKRVLDRGNPQK